jgi:hypothetical protein
VRTVLHILTEPVDVLAEAVLQQQRIEGTLVLRTFDLSKPSPNYDDLLTEVFDAEQVHVW